jgi:hypothetical protein
MFVNSFTIYKAQTFSEPLPGGNKLYLYLIPDDRIMTIKSLHSVLRKWPHQQTEFQLKATIS